MRKLSELIRKGAAVSGHCTDGFTDFKEGRLCTCALGAAALAMALEDGEDPDSTDLELEADLSGPMVVDEKTYSDDVKRRFAKALGVPYHGQTMYTLIVDANDADELVDERGRIADALEAVGL